MSRNRNKPITVDRAREGLWLFRHKVEVVRKRSFWSHRKVNAGVKFQQTPEGMKFENRYTGPSEEEIDALLLHFRFFLLVGEDSAIIHIPKWLRECDAPDEKITQVQALLDSYAKLMAESSHVAELSNERLLDVLIYGGRAHSNDEENVGMYRRLIQSPFIQAAEGLLLCTLIDGIFRHVLAIDSVLSDLQGIQPSD